MSASTIRGDFGELTVEVEQIPGRRVWFLNGEPINEDRANELLREALPPASPLGRIRDKLAETQARVLNEREQ